MPGGEALDRELYPDHGARQVLQLQRLGNDERIDVGPVNGRATEYHTTLPAVATIDRLPAFYLQPEVRLRFHAEFLSLAKRGMITKKAAAVNPLPPELFR